MNTQSTSDNVFTDIQPGFVEGNIKNNNNPDELVMGFFEVVDQTSTRIFFNYSDFFTEELSL